MGGVLLHHHVTRPCRRVTAGHRREFATATPTPATRLPVLRRLPPCDVAIRRGRHLREGRAHIAGKWEAAIHDIEGATAGHGGFAIFATSACPGAVGDRSCARCSVGLGAGRGEPLFRKRGLCSRPWRYVDPVCFTSCHHNESRLVRSPAASRTAFRTLARGSRRERASDRGSWWRSST